ncbi:cytochrome P450 [Thozetella sp. PMI_491]|nr:cytochrome P450 [Thozetella sp. PMI_491]
MNVATAVAAASLLLCVYLLHRWALPKPIPGIPYNVESAARITGDLPLLAKASAKRYLWFGEMAWKHKAPVVQVFLKPFAKPLVVVANFREVVDITLRRTKEFDAGPRTTKHFLHLVPDGHLTMSSRDPRFKHNTELIRDLMTPAFLNAASAPHIYEKANLLLKLWRMKSQICKGQAFDVGTDIHKYGLDNIMAIAFGVDPSKASLQRDLDYLEENAYSASSEEGDARLPQLGISPELQAMLTLTRSAGVVARNPLIALFCSLYCRMSPMKEALATKEKFISTELDNAVQRLRDGELVADSAKSALDQMILRETAAATKEGRAPHYYSRSMYDELFTYLIGGLDTTTSVMQWAVRYFAQHQDVQARLRQALWEAFPSARAECRIPTLAELLGARIAYLDAVIEEILRHAYVIGFFFREALCDTQILGKHIPKGTVLFLAMNGPGMLFPEVPVDESQRSDGAKRNKLQYGRWDPEDIGQFKPERWLRVQDGGDSRDQLEFNPAAGPFLNFGSGSRGCFGKRLAYLELRMTFALLVWTFDFTELSGELGAMDEELLMTRKPKLCYIKPKIVEMDP